MNDKLKIVLFVPDALSIRNYLYSDFIDELNKLNVSVFIYHNLSDEAISEIEKQKKEIKKTLKIPYFIENAKARMLRESISYGRLLRNRFFLNNQSIMHFWSRKNANLKQIFLYRFAEIFGFVLSKSYKLIRIADAFYEKEIGKCLQISQVESDLQSINPDLIINLHPRTITSALIANVAKKLKIKTTTVIFSWDNIPKARLISRYDHYFVWSELMKNDLNFLYPEINLNQIKVVGTPQFEFYFKEKYFTTKEKFFQEFGLNVNKKTICFSANDQLSPYEQNYFEDLCYELSTLNIVERPQILFRNCPVDKSSRFDNTLKKYNNFVKSIPPDWKIDKTGVIYPTYNDFYLLANTVKHTDLVINLGSTMAHDFAVLEKPCLYLNYDPVTNSKFKVKDVYEFQHFRSMKNLEAVGWINSKNDFIPKIIETLKKPNQTAKDRTRWLHKIVQHPLQESSKNLSKEIIAICTSVL